MTRIWATLLDVSQVVKPETVLCDRELRDLTAVEMTKQQLATMRRQAAEQAEAEWRTAFRPHAVILTE